MRKITGTVAGRATTVRQEARVVDLFRARQATDGRSARPLRDLRLNDSATLSGMLAAGIVRRAGADRYFLDETIWAGRRNLRGRDAIRVAVALSLAVFGVLLYSIAGR